MSTHAPTTEQLISRRALAVRWGVSVETVKRRERSGALRAVRFNARLVRYRVSEVEQYERDATA